MTAAIGNLDSPLQATVDPDGSVTPPSGAWRLGWWVRASDRWHVPADETASAVSQRLLDAAPVVETGMRVPAGQVIHRAWCTVSGADEWAVVEVENRSREPVGLALVVEGARTVGYRDRVVHVDGSAALVLPRPPARFATTPDDGGAETWSGEVRGPTVAFVFPLAHTARLRAALPLAAGRRVPPADLGALPDAERVANGWRSHAQPPGSLRVELPDERAADAVAADRAALLVTHDAPGLPVGDAAAALDVLDRCGHHDVARRALHDLVASLRSRRWDGAGPVLVALAGHHRRTGAALPDALVGPVAEAAHKLRRRAPDLPSTPAAQLAAAELLEHAGQPEAAARCRSLAGAAALPWASVAAGDPAGPAGRLAAALDGLLSERGDRLDLLPGLPDAWLGQGVEVHDAPTGAGPLSFALRWHGARPALLWQGTRPARLVATRLDPSWSTTDVRGEALLAPVEPAGGLPGVVAPLPREGTPASSAPEGGTFR